MKYFGQLLLYLWALSWHEMSLGDLNQISIERDRPLKSISKEMTF